MAKKNTSQTANASLASALRRDWKRWWWLFFGVWDALQDYDPKFRAALGKALTRAGLGADGFLNLRMLDPFPSQDVVDKAKRFYDEAISLKNLRGKTRRTIPPWYALRLYELIYEHIKDVPRRGYASPRQLGHDPSSPNFMQRYGKLSKCFQAIERDLLVTPLLTPQTIPSGRELKKWVYLTNRQVALQSSAHLLRISPARLKKILSQARKLPNVKRDHPLTVVTMKFPPPKDK